MAYNGEVTKAGDIVEWTDEQAAAWYPGKGWIKQIENPNPAPKPEPEKTEPVLPVIESPIIEPEPVKEVDPEYAEEKPEPEKTEPETEAEPEKVRPARTPKNKRR